MSDIPPRAADEEGKVEPAKIKVKLRLDIHGMLTLESAVAIEEQEVIEEVKPEPAPAPAAADPAPAADAPPADGAAPAEGAEAGEAAPAEAAEAATPAPVPEPEPEKKKTKKVKRVALSVAAKGGGITPQELMEAQEAEGNMTHLDKLIAATSEAMNALEATIYRLRDELSSRLSTYIAEKDKEELSAKLTALEDWLYDEGFDADKATYEGKRKDLEGHFAGGESRCKEAESRPEAYATLEAAIALYAGFAGSNDEAYEHIAAEEKQKVGAEVAGAQAWLADTKAKLDALVATDDPPVKAAEIVAKATALASTCKPIMDTPKPLPAQPDPPPAPEGEPAADAANPEGAAAEPAADADATPGAAATPNPDNMDVD